MYVCMYLGHMCRFTLHISLNRLTYLCVIPQSYNTCRYVCMYVSRTHVQIYVTYQFESTHISLCNITVIPYMSHTQITILRFIFPYNLHILVAYFGTFSSLTSFCKRNFYARFHELLLCNVVHERTNTVCVCIRARIHTYIHTHTHTHTAHCTESTLHKLRRSLI
jgi:hypothetical protein